MEELKECLTCGENIRAVAKKCPHCHTWQSKWTHNLSGPKLNFIIAILALGFLAFLLWRGLGGLLFPNMFEDSKHLIEIENTNLSFSEKSCGNRITILGTIINKGDIAWENFYFEVQFYNKNDELIDSLSDKVYDLVVLENNKSTFKITGSADKDEILYDRYLIFVKTAREIR